MGTRIRLLGTSCGMALALSAQLASAQIIVTPTAPPNQNPNNPAAVEQASIGQITEMHQRAQASQISGAISDHIGDVAERANHVREHDGHAPGGINAWLTSGNTSTHATDDGGVYHNDTQNVLIGADVMPFDNTILGLAVGIDNSSAKLASANGTLSSVGVSVTPYAALILGKHFTADVQITAAHDDGKVAQNLTPIPGAGNYGAWRYVGSANITGHTEFRDISLKLGLGYNFAEADAAGFTDTVSLKVPRTIKRLQMVKLSGEAAYNVGGAFEPFITVEAEQILSNGGNRTFLPGDLITPLRIEKTGVMAGGGVRYLIAQKVLFSLSGAAEVNRAKETQWVVDGNFQVTF